MDGAKLTLAQRVNAVLRAKQYLVFFAIGLYALDFAVPLACGWLYRHEPVAKLLDDPRGPLAYAVAARSAVIAALFVAYLLVGMALRAGYIRSLVGHFHLGPASRRQFLRLVVLGLALEVVGALAAGAIVLAGNDLAPASLVVLGQLAIYLAVLYADYIIVIADVGPLRAVALSWRTVRVTLIPSALIFLATTVIVYYAAGLLDQNVTGSLALAAPMMLVQCMLMGGVSFVVDVVLVVLYLDAVEKGRLKPQPRSAGDGPMLS
jgi:hypothetical protein